MSKEKASGTTAVVGLDIGTSRVVAAVDSDGARSYRSELNAFVAIPRAPLVEKSLDKEQVPHSVAGDQIVIFGNESARMADLLGKETRRPMTRGLLNPDEPESLNQLREILRSVLGEGNERAKVCFSVPAPAQGAEDSLTYHEATVRQLLDQLGFASAQSVNEGLAVVYSELEDTNFTGIGVSCGGGLCNVALAYLSVPVLSFSLAKGGDYIDTAAAGATGEMVNRVRLEKEESFHFNGHFADKVRQALAVYYDDMIASISTGLRDAFHGCRSVPRFGRPVPLVLSGGGVLPKGFRERFEKAISGVGLPIAVSEVRLARDPLNTTAQGALVAALSE
jgi:hypothetical protein